MEKAVEFPEVVSLEEMGILAKEWKLASPWEVEFLKRGEQSKHSWFNAGKYNYKGSEFLVCSYGVLVRASYSKRDGDWVLIGNDRSVGRRN